MTVSDDEGGVGRAILPVTVADTLPPTIRVSDPRTLWPPNHLRATFRLSDCLIRVEDLYDGTLDTGGAEIALLTSDEPDDAPGTGDGHSQRDMVIVDAQTVLLRAEREGEGDGRVYTVHFSTADAAGNAVTGQCLVQVPHDLETPAVDSGVAHSTTSRLPRVNWRTRTPGSDGGTHRKGTRSVGQRRAER